MLRRQGLKGTNRKIENIRQILPNIKPILNKKYIYVKNYLTKSGNSKIFCRFVHGIEKGILKN